MGFAELLVIAIVGLIVVGPERLPQAIKTGLVWFGRIKRLISETRSEFEQQLGVDEIRREIHNEEVLESLKSLKTTKQQVEDQAHKISDSVSAEFDDDEGLFGDQRSKHPIEDEEPLIKKIDTSSPKSDKPA